MKKIFSLLLATVAIGMTTNAQSASFMDPSQVMKGASSQNLAKAPKKAASDQTVYYNRPAGGFVSSYLYYPMYVNVWGIEEVYLMDFPLIALKPNAEYTFHSVNTTTENWTSLWDVYNPSEDNWYTQESQNLTIYSGEGSLDWNARVEVPILRTLDDDGNLINSYQLHGRNRYTNEIFPAQYLASNDFEWEDDEDAVWWLFSSKTVVLGGRFDDFEQGYYNAFNPFTYYFGCDPWGNNEDGFYFGKNAGYNGKHFDGIAQAFEKPEHPYILKHLVMFIKEMDVTEDCELTCKIYRLADGIPAYQENSSVSLPEEPGELIATGRAQLNAHQSDWADDPDNVVFTLYGDDGNVITPTINDAILIAFDGYNEPEMDALTNFTAMISDDTDADEGFGELAYIKYKDDTMDEYEWCGLNNFFGSGTMELKTGFSIFITLAFSDEEMEQTATPVINVENNEEGEYLIISATGDGNVKLYIDGVQVTNPIQYNYQAEEHDIVITATAQEDGKEISETAELTYTVPAKTPEPVQTPAPSIEVTPGDDSYTFTAVGEGEITLYLNDVEVENPYTVNRIDVDQTVMFMAVAHIDGQIDGTVTSEYIVPALEVTPPEPYETPAPVVTSELTAEALVLTATGEGSVTLYIQYVDNETGDLTLTTYTGEGTVTVPVPRVEEDTYINYWASAQANEESLPGISGVTYYVLVPALEVTPPEPQVTPQPEITYEVTDDAVIITATGEGEVLLYVDGEPVENPCTIERGATDVVVVVTATAQAEDMLISDEAMMEITIPAISQEPEDPYATGNWVVFIDKDGNEQYYELVPGDDPDGVQQAVALTWKLYGHPVSTNPEDWHYIPFYFLVNGVTYGPDADGTEPVMGNANMNPLFENENMWQIQAGYKYVVGIVTDIETGNKYVQISQGTFVDVDEFNADKTVAGVRYFNMIGQEMQEVNGMTIVVTTYTDGTINAVKVMK